MAALVLAIASFLVCPFVTAIVALFLAANAKKNIAASGGTITGQSLAQAATVVSWVNIGLCVLVVVLIVVVAATGSSSNSSSSLATLLPRLS